MDRNLKYKTLIEFMAGENGPDYQSNARIMAKKNVPFVLKEYPKRGADFEGGTDYPLDLPFDCCSFEVLGGQPLAIKHNVPDPSNPDKMIETDVTCIGVIELSFNNYHFYVISDAEFGTVHGNELRSCFASYSEESSRQNEMRFMVKSILDQLKTSSLHTENVRIQLKLKYRTGKEFERVRRIVVVGPKSKTKPVSLFGGHIDFQHRFEVCGHWRRIDGLGKNRAGEYCINGFTWVIAHVRGPDDKPLIKKTRVVSNELASLPS